MFLGCFGQENKELNHLPSSCPSATGLLPLKVTTISLPSPREGLNFPRAFPAPDPHLGAHAPPTNAWTGNAPGAWFLHWTCAGAGARRRRSRRRRRFQSLLPGFLYPSCPLGYGCRWPFLQPQGAGGRWGQGPGCREGVVLSLTAAPPALRHSPPGVFSPGLLPGVSSPRFFSPGLSSPGVSPPGSSFPRGFLPGGSPPRRSLLSEGVSSPGSRLCPSSRQAQAGPAGSAARAFPSGGGRWLHTPGAAPNAWHRKLGRGLRPRSQPWPSVTS